MLSRGALIRVPMQHWHQEISESLRLSLVELILLLQNFLEWPEVQAMDVSEHSCRTEILATALAGKSERFGHSAE